MSSLGPRRHLPELLDADDVAPADAERSAAALSRVNLRFGGDRALKQHLRNLRRAPRLSVLDVGGGRGDLPLRLQEWARRGGGGWRMVVLDRHPLLTRMAGRWVREGKKGAEVVRGDALRIPFRDDTFDVVTCNLVLHHFRDEDAVQVLREMGRVARRRVVVNDLERHRVHYLAVRLLSATLWRRDPITRTDAPRSVLQAFTREELADLARKAGLAQGTVRRHVPYRLVLDATATATAHRPDRERGLP